MNSFSRLLLVVARLAFVASCLGAGAAHAQPATIRVSGVEDAVAMVPVGQLLEDKSGTQDLAAVRGAQSGWTTAPSSALILGFSNSVWWMRWQIENTAHKRVNLVVDLGSPREDYVTWFVLRDGGAAVAETASGDRQPFANRPLPTRHLTLPLTLAAGERVELYVRLANHDGMFEPMPIQLSGQHPFMASSERENLLYSLFHGGLLALLLYNFLLFIATRERGFGLYVLYLGSFLLWSFTFRGYSFQYLWPDSVTLNNNLVQCCATMVFAFSVMFSINYLQVRERCPRWLLRAHYAAVAVSILGLLPGLTGHYALTAKWVIAVAGPTAIMQMATGTWLLFRGSRAARFYMASFLLLTAGVLGYMLQVSKLVPINSFSPWGIPIGSSLEVLLLALGLADSMNTLKAQKLAAERRAREAQEALTGKLEQQVHERTEELEKANLRLQELSITDALTGVFNRRHFNETCEAALAGKRRKDPLAFCMFDIDHFKSFNDRYGHQAGDDALRRVAGAVQAELRRSGDELFRLGGEEFGVLFTAPSPEAAQQFVERLREAVRKLHIAHAGSAMGIVTASFGIAWWSADNSGLTADKVYARADRVLYEAKSGGRDRVGVEAL